VAVAVPWREAVARITTAIGEVKVADVAEAQGAGCYRPRGDAVKPRRRGLTDPFPALDR
jgi:hypothetical protein